MRLSTSSWSSIWVIIGNTKWFDKTESKVVSTMSSLVNKRKNQKISKILTWFNQKRCKNLCLFLQLGNLIQVLTLHVISLATNINALTLIRCTFASILLFVMEIMFWILVGIKRCYICNAKFLSKSFHRFCTMFELFEDKQRAKLGGVDAPKMHLLFQSLCFIICSGVFPYLNKTAESDAVFSKVSFLVVFAGN